MRNHARELLACDFFVAVTARFRLVYVFVVLDVGTRQLLHWNVTEHPTAEWTVQQFRTCVTGEGTHRFIVHDRDSIYSEAVDLALRTMGLRVLKTPVAVPQARRTISYGDDEKPKVCRLRALGRTVPVRGTKSSVLR